MSLAGVLDVLADDPAVRAALDAALSGSSPAHLDLTAPSPMRPFLIAALAAKADRPVLAVTATGRESEDLVASLRSLLPPDSVAEYPAWETLPHERLSPRADTVGRRLAVLRRLRHPNTGPDDDPATGPIKVVVAPVRSVLQPQVPGLGDLVPVRAAGRQHRRARGRRSCAGRGCLSPGRSRREARRDCRTRRHSRRLPAHGGAPAAGGVLGRHGRGDPLLQGRRPALARGRRQRAVGAAVPRAAADR